MPVSAYDGVLIVGTEGKLTQVYNCPNEGCTWGVWTTRAEPTWSSDDLSLVGDPTDPILYTKWAVSEDCKEMIAAHAFDCEHATFPQTLDVVTGT